jgi:hypothetical protein
MSIADAGANTRTEKKTAKGLLEGVRVVDADTHISEWPDLWTSRAPAKYKDRVPQVRNVNGKNVWTIDDHIMSGDSGFAAIKKDGSKAPGIDFFDLKLTDVHPGAYDSFNVAMHEEVADALGKIASSGDARTLLLTGEGRGFCAGQDLNDRVTSPGAETGCGSPRTRPGSTRRS